MSQQGNNKQDESSQELTIYAIRDFYEATRNVGQVFNEIIEMSEAFATLTTLIESTTLDGNHRDITLGIATLIIENEYLETLTKIAHERDLALNVLDIANRGIRVAVGADDPDFDSEIRVANQHR